MANPIDIWRGSRNNPFRELNRLQSAFDEMFENFPTLNRPRGGKEFDFSPTCEISEDTNQYQFKFDLPGVPKDLVKIEINDNTLTVSAERREEKKSDTKKTHFSEINYGSYTRTFTLPSAVDEKNVDARFDNGVLTIALPKTAPTKAKKIEIH